LKSSVLRIASPSLLAKRIKKVLYDPNYAGREMRAVIKALEPLGTIAVFGGMLRDLAASRPAAFSSDIDLVISTTRRQDMDSRLAAFSPKRTRYGGYRISKGGWTIDIWILDDTWAFRTGLVPEPSFRQLTQTSFFNWDAIVFELATEQLWVPDNYFKTLKNRLLEINLEPNANPAGNVVRALRSVIVEDVRLGPRLASYIVRFVRRIREQSPAEMPEEYTDWFADRQVLDVLARIERHIRERPQDPFELRNPIKRTRVRRVSRTR
jgi:predicted nucleotidyltransferase